MWLRNEAAYTIIDGERQRARLKKTRLGSASRNMIGWFVTNPLTPFPLKIAIAFNETDTAMLVWNRLGGRVAMPNSPLPSEIALAFKENATAIFVGRRIGGFATGPLGPSPRAIAPAYKGARLKYSSVID